MELDIKKVTADIKRDLKIPIYKFTGATGLCRQSVYNAINNNNGIMYLTPDKYYALATYFPDYVKLPDDFFDYTKTSYYVHKAIYGFSIDDVTERCHMSSSRIHKFNKIKSDYLYGYKQLFHDVFPTVYKLYMIDSSGIISRVTQGVYKPKLNSTLAIHRAYKYDPDATAPSLRKRFTKDNLIANMEIYQISLNDIVSILSPHITRYAIRKGWSTAGSIERERLCFMFDPFIFCAN